MKIAAGSVGDRTRERAKMVITKEMMEIREELWWVID